MGNFFIKTSKDDTFTVRDSYTCPWSRESQLYPGLHQQKHGQQGRGDGPASLSQYVQPNRADTVEMGSGDSMSWMLCSESLSPSICLPWALTWKYCDSFCIAIQRSYSCDTGMYWAHFQIFSHVMAPSGFSSSEPSHQAASASREPAASSWISYKALPTVSASTVKFGWNYSDGSKRATEDRQLPIPLYKSISFLQTVFKWPTILGRCLGLPYLWPLRNCTARSSRSESCLSQHWDYCLKAADAWASFSPGRAFRQGAQRICLHLVSISVCHYPLHAQGASYCFVFHLIQSCRSIWSTRRRQRVGWGQHCTSPID